MDMTAKITKIADGNVSLEIQNTSHPFYGKKLEVGATSEKDGASFKVISMTESGVTMEVKNSRSPFFGKEYSAGAVAITNDQLGNTGSLKIVSMSGDTVDIEVPNPHPQAGKTLYFDIEILDIK
jgi:hypothetical protein